MTTKTTPPCPFCRTPNPETDKEMFKRERKRDNENDDAQATYNLGMYYSEGLHGYPQDYSKALEFWHRAAKFGHAASYNSIGTSYIYGEGVEVDKKKAGHYYELAAMGGSVTARLNLGNNEASAGNMDRAVKHYMIAARGGYANSLNNIKVLYSAGHATKENYTQALRAYQEYLDEIKSPQRNEAAAFDAHNRYY